ncbi:hypothetical protein GALMADRAFT_76982 [Galerina marginata CBS 339.88]|uniref:Protein kinase domain-containing protein n=1 Tax=Galerina marginata (strain CBS 339.88) TaxID=685588 RepID=A0A067SFZ3_GALM3|nr:hypothetical protein GALMADRAFT_76982 [Galerina marginata CBS 339.88]
MSKSFVGRSGKRARSVTETEFDHMKRSKLAMTAPSTMAQPSYYEENQKTSSEKILDDRPKVDPHIAPISLLYDGFGDFLDIFDGRADVPGLAEVNILELHKAVDDFALKMCRFYDNDDERRTAALPALNCIFSARTGTTIPSLLAAAIGSLRTDGHNVTKHGGGALIAQFKNRSAGINAIPEVELTGYVAHSHATGMEEHQDLFERWRVPSLGLTVVGPDLRFYGIIAIDHQYRLVNLTPNLSCIPSASDGRDRKALYKAFSAASVLQARILEDAQKFLTALPPEIQPTARRFPSVTQLRKWGSSTEYISFQILGFHPDRQDYRLLYLAETTGPEKRTIVIKFVPSYSVDLHAFCANRGFAPPILAFEQLPGGWKAVAMGYIPSGTIITKSSGLDTHRDRWTHELLQLVNDFHVEGLVHGDLRDANIICNGHDMMLLDFDWGGQDGQVFYPTPNLNSELLEGRSSNDLKITKEDDNRILKKTLGKLT